MKRCYCGAEITKEQDSENSRVAQETKTKKLDMCDECWGNYCYHAITGD